MRKVGAFSSSFALELCSFLLKRQRKHLGEGSFLGWVVMEGRSPRRENDDSSSRWS